MSPSIEITFQRLPKAPGIEAAVQRWVARLEVERAIRSASVVIELRRARETLVRLAVTHEMSIVCSAAAHDDAYVAVSNAFRDIRRQLLERRR